MMRSLSLCVVCWLILTTWSADHTIQLLRPVEVGDRCNYNGQAVLAETVTVANASGVISRRIDGYAVDLKAIREVLTVDDAGRATALSFEVVYCTKTRDNRMKEMVPRGALLTARFEDGEERFSVDGTPVDTETAEALSILIVLADEGPTIDEVFGTEDDQPVGGRWPVRPAPAARSFANSGLTVKPEAVTGEVGLAEITSVGGRDCLKIVGALGFSSVGVSLPESLSLVGGTLDYRFESYYPLGMTGEPVREQKEMVSNLTTREKARPEVEIVSVTRQTARIQKTPL